MSKSKSSHVHSYKKVLLRSRADKRPYIVYVCDKRGCHHYVPKELVVGRECVCHRCKHIFTVTKDRLRGATYLFCRDCIRSKNEMELPPIPEILP